jgi:RNA polymerase sigma-70 factor (ECF subfamily)
MANEAGNNISNQREEELVQCLQSNDRHRFALVYDTYSAALLNLIIHWSKDLEAAENLLQDVFVKAWQNRDQYDSSKGRLFTWLYNIAKNCSIDYLRSKVCKQGKTSVLNINSPLLLPTANMVLPDTIGLRNMINKLRQEEKKMIELKYFSGLTQQEIATALNIPIGTVKTRINSAIKKLRVIFISDNKRTLGYISLN